jgi:hypothetical protein
MLNPYIELPDGHTIGETFLVPNLEQWWTEIRTATELLQIAAARHPRKEHHHG